MVEGKKETKKECAAREKEEARAELEALFRKADFKVYTKLEHVSRSGMLRHVSAFVIVGNEPFFINHLIARLGLYRRVPYGGKGEGLKVGGCGFDSGFDVVYNTSRQVFGTKGFVCRGEGCPSNDHVNGDANRKPHIHSDAGYCLKQAWI